MEKESLINLSPKLQIPTSQIIGIGYFNTGGCGCRIYHKYPVILLTQTDTLFGRSELYNLTKDHYESLREKLTDSFICVDEPNIMLNPLHVNNITRDKRYWLFGMIVPCIYYKANSYDWGWQEISEADYAKLKAK